MRSYFYLGLNFALVLLSLRLHDLARVWMARRCGDALAADRQRSAENPFARVDWIGSVLLPAFLLWRHVPALGWTRPLEPDPDKLRRPRRDGLRIALAGPAAGLLLALAGIGLARGLNSAGWMASPLLLQVLPAFCLNNACLAVFNLLPIPPLAGAAAAELFLDGDALSAYEDVKPYGFILILAGVFFNFFDFVTQPVSRLVQALIGL
ncbi:MAG: site-2 protease family protein [Acidobacteria bacterium]|nr:site-2 protease family protein [Acidobacteriota bacterium]